MAPIGRCGPYELLRFIDAGGMGEIFLARGPSPAGPRSLVAIKRLLPQVAADRTFVGMFMDEAHLATRLEHPNVARVFQLGRDGDRYFLVMEWVDGVSVRSLIRRIPRIGPLPWPVVARIAADTAKGLDYAHRLTDAAGKPYHVVHRDVSPPNVMVGFDGRTRLLDFGLAKARTQLEKTKSGMVKGKFAYLAPEQLRGEITPRIDLFALGACCWEALTGRQLFDQRTAAATVAAIQNMTEPPRIAPERTDVPDALEAIVRRALSPDPAARFESAADMRDALERVLAAEGERMDERALAAWLEQAVPDREPLPQDEAPPAQQSIAELVDADAPSGSGAGRVALVAAAVALAVIAAAVALSLV